MADEPTLTGGDDDSGAEAGDGGGPDGTPIPGSDGGLDSGSHEAGAPKPHVVFITSATYSGDLVGAAAAIDDDAGKTFDAGAEPSYLAAGDFLCQHAADAAGLSGTYAVMLTAGGDEMLSRFTSADGPWALVNGTPIADRLSDLATGRWYAPIDVTEKGSELPLPPAFQGQVWALGQTGHDCMGWTSANGANDGNGGLYNMTLVQGLDGSGLVCAAPAPLRCAQVGSGAGTNSHAAVPAGGKIAFYASGPFTGAFAASSGAGVLDGSAPDAGDDIHTVADGICNEVARGSGVAGTFHAWISSSSASAVAFFAATGTSGPWYRPDGVEIAAQVSELTATGARTEIELRADGTFSPLSGDTVWTGTTTNGSYSSVNCSGFSDTVEDSVVGYAGVRGTDWAADESTIQCSANTGGLYCFQQ